MNNEFIVDNNMINDKQYDGNTLKFGITVNNTNYIVKYPKDGISSVFSEHIASRFIRNLGINCHETYLGYHNKNIVVIMKDFTNSECKLRSYKSTRQSSEGTSIEGKEYTYKDVLYMINKHTKMSDSAKHKAVTQFWDMFICDAILGNRDRHHGNWGYLTYKTGYIPAPIYDNGGSLFPDIYKKINEYKTSIINNKEFTFMAERSEKFPASLFQIETANGKVKRTNYYEILGDLRVNKTLAKEVKAIKEKIGFNQVYEAIFRAVEGVNNIVPYEYKRFYILVTCTRYLHLIERKDIKKSYIQSVRRLESDGRVLW